MNNLFNFFSSNALASSLAAAAILGTLTIVVKFYKNQRDSRLVYNFLLASKSDTKFTFRTTQAIASHTGLTEIRVEAICASHPKIRRNEKQTQSWTLA